MSEDPFLHLDRLTRTFSGSLAVRELTLEIAEHEIVTLLGPSGCGKTTTLRLVAGFETPDAGHIRLRGRDLTRTAPQRRGFGMVFQHYALFPHLDVGSNVAFGLERSGLDRDAVEVRVAGALDLVGLPGTQRRSVGSLSGGQQQRVALARALAPEPEVLLLDEPLSNLDAALRERTRRELRTLVKEIGITSIYVTHDQEEAFALSDRIAVMREGHLDQVGLAEELYRRPATEFVATFLGRVGVVAATVERFSPNGDVVCRLPGDATWTATAPAAEPPLEPGAAIRLMARPEAVEICGPDEAEAVRGVVDDRRFAGSVYVYTIEVEGGRLEVQATGDVARVGAAVGLRPPSAPDGLFAFPARSSEAAR
ncbi:MAG: ABC transporter ATP-binding protein [Gemmatimonadetes bacterium]|uniref:ABC transporter ATP-binding protein n=1 Tax=Candidatus Kutchimonas denitrificans TaxID=3056748 RepID=A0AAE4Z8F8_9BACT|nr:ABC transporter ATP-binding protein [Gemmatimonadota bacterium]NIR74908.1 ABC transporter ATP-binding protein [Candidatus Kutchimonas denitrificans]NIS00020.1 ABC transporter ATP-binding protein [Gemmatimonadota bacterium]NIT65603.1 ABC transporter ATP-binding protein [Gemmatimonadota bacterium]NIU52573.1 ATP-binding cassette domain-containing protein [Gemmatimonadota bacterium]